MNYKMKIKSKSISAKLFSVTNSLTVLH